MVSRQKKEEEAIFKAAVKLKIPEERTAYIDQACGNDLGLKARITALCRIHEAEDDILAPIVSEANFIDPTSSISETPGSIIDRYKLLEKIGEGGMAVVYMAEQTEPIRRKVALKIIKLGMDTKSVIARFEAERQALAMMDHPNIAKVLDAGATETGRPYFVMELVTGVSITEYCDKNNLSTKERLALFIQVCNAVQHAHQKGIIHRDIKPTNVMVAHHDGKPVPKVIDFGIAKATKQRLTEKTLFTRYAHIIGTPAYMSPEQADLSDFDVDTRSDIYSLGVLLYELLTGTTPFSEEELRKAGYIEMQRVIREQEPAKPSTKLSTLGETLTGIAQHRGCTADLLRRAVRGDLDWIVMKALEKDRIRRYETATEFARDIQRYLGNEPISAGSPGMIYSVHKFVRRHRTSVAFGLVFIASLIIGLSLAIIGFMQASRQRDLAEMNFKKAREAVDQMLTHVAEELPRLPGMSKKLDSAELTKIKQALLESALKYYEGFLEERSSDLNVRYETAHAYMRVGDITRNLKQDKRAEETYLAAAKLLEELVAEFPNELDYQIDLAFAYHGYGDMLRNARRIKEKNDIYRKAIISYGNAIELDPDNPDYWSRRASVYRELKQWDKALTDCNKAIELEPGASWPWSIRADVYRELKQFDKAMADSSKAIELEPGATWPWSIRSFVYRGLERWDDALADSSKAIELDPNNPHGWIACADVYRELEQWNDALAAASKAIELDRNIPEPWIGRAIIYRELEQWDDALADSSKAIELDPNNPHGWIARANVYRELEQWDDALADCTKAIELDRTDAHYWHMHGLSYLRLGEPGKAVADYTNAIELTRTYAHYWHMRGVCYLRLGEPNKAVADYTKAIELDPEGESGPYWSQRARAYQQLAQYEKARSDSTKAIELDPNSSGRWYRRANIYADTQQWSEAVADYSRAIELDPNNAYVLYRRALAHLGMGDTEGYRSRCAQMLDRFGQTEEAATAHSLAWTCALAGDAVEDFNRVVELAEFAIEKGGTTDQSLTTLGAILYRAGRLDEAVQTLSGLATEWEQGKELPTQASPAYAWFFLAMAHHHLGHADESQRYFELAAKRAEQEMTGAALWNRKLTLQLLRAEVESLLGVSERNSSIQKEIGSEKEDQSH